LNIPYIFILISLCTSRLLLFKSKFQTQLLDSKTMLHALLHALRVNFDNFGHTTKNTIFRLVKLLADLSTRLNSNDHRTALVNAFTIGNTTRCLSKNQNYNKNTAYWKMGLSLVYKIFYLKPSTQIG